MEYLIKYIREQLNLSQTEFGEKLGVSFSTVNRWENGKALPNRMAQLRIFDLVTKCNIEIADRIYDRIYELANSIPLSEGRILLYHGSKSGIEGDIMPKSREKCDFGRGFYMGSIPEQPLTLICDYNNAKLYIVSISLNYKKSLEIKQDFDWAMYVAFNRGRMEEIKETELYKKYKSLSSDYDLLIGSIANDRMFFVLDNFFQGNVTDKALVESLSALKLGKQYVAVTEEACRDIRIEKEIELSLLERKCLQKVADTNRKKGISMADEICRKYRRDGLFFDEILEEAR